MLSGLILTRQSWNASWLSLQASWVNLIWESRWLMFSKMRLVHYCLISQKCHQHIWAIAFGVCRDSYLRQPVRTSTYEGQYQPEKEAIPWHSNASVCSNVHCARHTGLQNLLIGLFVLSLKKVIWFLYISIIWISINNYRCIMTLILL